MLFSLELSCGEVSLLAFWKSQESFAGESIWRERPCPNDLREFTFAILLVTSVAAPESWFKWECSFTDFAGADENIGKSNRIFSHCKVSPVSYFYLHNCGAKFSVINNVYELSFVC